jgi:CheY-like chemotaxis protein
VKHLVELHGGIVTADSPGAGQGATFTVTLPLSTVSIPVATAVPAPATAPALDVPSHLRRLDGIDVLVVDDDRDSLALTSAIFVAAGATVRTSMSATEALSQFRREPPGVLVSDLEMPGEDGYSLVRKVRALPADQGGQTPTVALTAYGRPQDRERCLAAGFTMHIAKPIDPGELTARIASLVANQPITTPASAPDPTR